MAESTHETNDRPERPQGDRRGPGGPRPPRGGAGERRDSGDRAPRRFQRRFRGKVCQFCVDKAIYIDYKDLERLSRFVSPHGKILPRRMTGTCSRHMRMLTRAIKRARVMALLPYTLR